MVRRCSKQAVRACPRRRRGLADNQLGPRLFRMHARRPRQEDLVLDRHGVAWHGQDSRTIPGANWEGIDDRGASAWGWMALKVSTGIFVLNGPACGGEDSRPHAGFALASRS